jgi:predicted ArsR family transcriptional regulator
MSLPERIVNLLENLKDKRLSVLAMAKILGEEAPAVRHSCDRLVERNVLERAKVYCLYSKRICYHFWLKGRRTR